MLMELNLLNHPSKRRVVEPKGQFYVEFSHEVLLETGSLEFKHELFLLKESALEETSRET